MLSMFRSLLFYFLRYIAIHLNIISFWGTSELQMQEWMSGTADMSTIELYTDESPGLKVDPVVVLVLSLGFIFSVVALHSMLSFLLNSGLTSGC